MKMKYPRLKIADYGLSRAFGDDSTLMQTNVGTFIYLSPEIKYHKGATHMNLPRNASEFNFIL